MFWHNGATSTREKPPGSFRRQLRRGRAAERLSAAACLADLAPGEKTEFSPFSQSFWGPVLQSQAAHLKLPHPRGHARHVPAGGRPVYLGVRSETAANARRAPFPHQLRPNTDERRLPRLALDSLRSNLVPLSFPHAFSSRSYLSVS